MSGEIPVGARLPPQRELALLVSVGRTTVVTAYNLLRGESLVEMAQGAGTWVVGRSESATGRMRSPRIGSAYLLIAGRVA